VLAVQDVVVPADGAALPVRLSYRPGEEGDFEFVLEVEPAEGEVNTVNNRLSQQIRVRDATQRVLLVQSYPSYEYRFLKDLLARAVRHASGGTERAIQLTSILQEADLENAREDATAQSVFPVRREDLFAYDVLVFGDVDPNFLSPSAMEHVVEFVTDHGGGAIFLAGPSFTPLAYRDTPLAKLLPVDVATATAPSDGEILTEPFVVRPTPLGLTTPFMQLGETAAETESTWQRLTGLTWLLAAPDVRPAARVLAVHPTRTGPQGEPLPVILLQFVGAGKVMLHATDETYRWSRFPGSQQSYSRYWLQTLRYLSRSQLGSSGESLEISTDRQQYQRGEVVRVRVRFADERQAPAEDDGVTVVIQQSGGRQHQITLRRDPIRRQLFEGAISDLPDGQYRLWPATPGSQATAASFSIAAPPGEQARLAMDSADLRRAAKASQGRFYTFRDASRILEDLPRGRRVSIESLPPQPLWNSSLLAAVFVILITTEWLLRKRCGML
jgi:uncharacterized membrane protein